MWGKEFCAPRHFGRFFLCLLGASAAGVCAEEPSQVVLSRTALQLAPAYPSICNTLPQHASGTQSPGMRSYGHCPWTWISMLRAWHACWPSVQRPGWRACMLHLYCQLTHHRLDPPMENSHMSNASCPEAQIP